MVAVPFYSPSDAVRGLVRHHTPALAQAFEQQAQDFATQVSAACASSSSPSSTALLAPWQATMSAWEALATPAIGSVLQRRSQRQLDSGPVRLHLLQKAMSSTPTQLADLERVAVMAKGLPAMEHLLRTPSLWTQASACAYLSLLAQELWQEAQHLNAEAQAQARLSVATSDEELDASSASAIQLKAQYVEWLNQWLGGVERLRWAQLEKPIRTAQTAGHRAAPVFARGARAANLQSWRSQWQSLLALGRMNATQRLHPPAPGAGVVSIEALLRGQGHIQVADRWGQTLDVVSTRLQALPARAPNAAQEEAQLLAVAAALKAVTALFQQEVATALDIPLGFSDADGD
jgi:predicted lipoprotein